MGHGNRAGDVWGERFRWTGASFALVCAALLLTLVVPAGALADSPNVEVHTQDEIRAHVIASGATVDQETVYTSLPDMDAPYESAGSTCINKTLNPALAMLNNMRYIAGLDADVTLDSDMTDMAQAASYVNAVNDKLSHYPDKPEGMSDDIYNLGATGARKSNIGRGYRTLNEAIVNGWMADDDSGNIDRLGHRRWALNPKMGKTGFGAVGSYTAMYAHDASAGGAQSKVAWPAQQMPLDYFGDNYPWSLSTGRQIDATKVRVKLTRESDGKTWNFQYGQDSDPSAQKYFNVNNDYYGAPGCIIFRPDDVSYQPGDVFDVEIAGATESPIIYKVNFFDLYPVTGITLDKQELSLSVGRWSQLKATIEPSNATVKNVTWSSSDESIATVSRWGSIEAKKAGTATITASARGASAQTVITVTKPVTGVKITDRPSSMRVGDTYKMTAEVTPPDAGDKTVSWSSSDEGIATIDENGTVKAVGVGSVSILAKAGSYTTWTSFFVHQALVDISRASVSVENHTYSGYEQTPTVTATLDGQPLFEGRDYTVAYSDNVNVGTANVTIAGIGDYTGSATQSFQIVALKPAKPETGNDGKSEAETRQPETKPAEPAKTSEPSGSSKQASNFPRVGTVFTAKLSGGSVTCEVTANGKVKLISASIKKNRSVTIDTASYHGKTYKITSVGSMAFYKTKARGVVLGKNVKSIGFSAFSNCKYLKSFVVGRNVKSIGEYAFEDSKKLKTITVKSKALNKKGVKLSLKGSKVSKVKVPKSKKRAYKKFFTKANCGKKVKVAS